MASVSNPVLLTNAAPVAKDSGAVMLAGSAATDASNEFSFAQALAQLQGGAALPISPALFAASQAAAVASDQGANKETAADALALLLGNAKVARGGKGLPTSEQTVQLDGKLLPGKLSDETALVMDASNVGLSPVQLPITPAAAPIVVDAASANAAAPNVAAGMKKLTDAVTANVTTNEVAADVAATAAENVLPAIALANSKATSGQSTLPNSDSAVPKFELTGSAGNGVNTSFSDWLSKTDVAGVAARTLGSTLRVAERETPLPTSNLNANTPFAMSTLDNGGLRANGNLVVTNVPVPVQSHDWSQAFSEKVVYLVKQDIQGAEIRLNPAHLGPVEVRIAINQDQAHVTLTASHGATREALEASLPKLREMLADSGLTLAGASVSGESLASDQHRRESAFNMTGDPQQHGHFEAAQPLTEELVSEEQLIETKSSALGAQVLDVFA